MDRTEEWRRCAEALGLSSFRWSRGSEGDHSPVRSVQAVRQLLPALVQVGREEARRSKGHQAGIIHRKHLASACLVLRACQAPPRRSCLRYHRNLTRCSCWIEMRAVQAYLATLADGETAPPMTSEPPNL